MTRYTEHPVSLDFDSRQDEDGAACAECLSWTRDELLEPCPPGVTGQRGSVCGECAEMLRAELSQSASNGDGADRMAEFRPARGWR